jgi:hypothetical protein
MQAVFHALSENMVYVIKGFGADSFSEITSQLPLLQTFPAGHFPDGNHHASKRTSPSTR